MPNLFDFLPLFPWEGPPLPRFFLGSPGRASSHSSVAMNLELVESDKPKSLGEKIAEYLARPPQPALKFYGGIERERSLTGRYVTFAVRNGLPLPLLYGIYAEVRYDGLTDYIEKTDHIGPFSTDNWRLSVDCVLPAQVKIRVGLIPFEILSDRVEIAV